MGVGWGKLAYGITLGRRHGRLVTEVLLVLGSAEDGRLGYRFWRSLPFLSVYSVMCSGLVLVDSGIKRGYGESEGWETRAMCGTCFYTYVLPGRNCIKLKVRANVDVP
jgi:hypothetical protein